MKHKLLDYARFFASREAGFLLATLGVISQAWHTFFIAVSLSSLEGWQKYLQGGIMALFLSCALLFFIVKSSDSFEENDNSIKAKRSKKYKNMVIQFTLVESCINIYYWLNHLVLSRLDNPDWYSMVIALPFAILLPLILKAYGGEIRVDEKYEEIEMLVNNTTTYLTKEEILELIPKSLTKEEILELIPNPISKEEILNLVPKSFDLNEIKILIQESLPKEDSLKKDEILELIPKSISKEEILEMINNILNDPMLMTFKTKEGKESKVEIKLNKI